ncbi:MAG: hypothetical protein JXE06_06825 [Coriobacteriia bacterium]|nr:hypothetical protein [Coriobacteriia bacterium]MBN2822504.1 hypothetical protein [Coriobacteriia bacterium]
MTPDIEAIRIAYLAWVRRSTVPGAALVLLIAAEQIAVGAGFWGAPGGGESLRYLFWAAAVAGAFLGRGLKQRGTHGEGAGTITAAVSLSWTLVLLAVLPAVVGFVLSLMTRSVLDFFTMLLVSLGAYVVLFPRYKDWLLWLSPPAAGTDTADTADTTDAARVANGAGDAR